ncbi:MAG: polysaccharide pyruvyl transferase family protein [Candidatus Auribacterota bacterium]
MRVLILGQPSDNRGDEAAARGMIYGIRSLIPNAIFDIVYCYKDFKPVMDDPPHVVSHHKRFLMRLTKWNIFIHLWYLLLYRLGIASSAGSDENVLAKLIVEADAVIYAPQGPYLGGKSIQFRPLFFLALVKMYAKKLMIYAPSMGPFLDDNQSFFYSIKLNILKKVLNSVNMITLRDSTSSEFVKKLNLRNKNVFLASDSALQNPVDQLDGKKLLQSLCIPGPNKLIGITPIELSWHTHWATVKDIDTTIAAISAEILDSCIEKYNAHILFFPQLYGNPGKPFSSDLPVMYNIAHYMKHKDKFTVVDIHWETEQQQSVMALMDVFVGYRHHSAVLCAKMKIPCVCISYEYKAISFMEDIQLSEYALPLENLRAKTVLRLIDNALNNRADIVRHLTAISEKLRKTAFISSEKFAEMVTGTPSC